MKAEKASRSGLVTLEEDGPLTGGQKTVLTNNKSDLFSSSHIGNMVCCFRISDVGAAHTCISLVEAFSGH